MLFVPKNLKTLLWEKFNASLQTVLRFTIMPKQFTAIFVDSPENLKDIANRSNSKRWSRGHKARGKGQKYKKSEAKDSLSRKDSLEAKDRNARGQGLSTQMEVLSKKKRS